MTAKVLLSPKTMLIHPRTGSTSLLIIPVTSHPQELGKQFISSKMLIHASGNLPTMVPLEVHVKARFQTTDRCNASRVFQLSQVSRFVLHTTRIHSSRLIFILLHDRHRDSPIYNGISRIMSTRQPLAKSVVSSIPDLILGVVDPDAL